LTESNRAEEAANGTPEQIAGYKAWAPDFDAQE
jgi:hypothetical protein